MNHCVLAHAVELNFWKERSVIARNVVRDEAISPFPGKDEIASSLRSAPRNDSTFGLTSRFGTVRRVTPGSSGKTVISIQDIHLNQEAQSNIGSAIDELLQNKNTDLIALEGSFAAINISRFRAFDDQSAIQKAARYALTKNEISGPVYSALTSKHQVPALIGIDDEKGYQANVEAYRRSFPLIEKVKDQLESARKELDHEAERVLDPMLFALYEKSNEYRAGKIGMGAYVGYLSDSGVELPLALETFSAALKMEAALDFKLIEAQRTQFFEHLATRHPKALESLGKQGTLYKLGVIKQADFYRSMRDICARNGVNLNQFPLMASYIRYLLLSDGIDLEKLYTALRETERQAQMALAKTQEQKTIFEKSDHLALAVKLADFALTPEEWNEYKAVIARSEATRQSHKLIHEIATPSFAGLAMTFFEDFYRQADNRSELIAENLLKQLDKPGVDTAVLVTGGFHAQDIARRLSKKKVAVVSFTPRISKVDTASGSAYLNLFMQEKSPLEKLFEGRKLFLSQNPANLNGLPFETAAIKAVTTPNVPSQNVINRLLPENHGVELKTDVNGTQVTETITTKNGVVKTFFDLDQAGNIVSGVIANVNPLPELLAIVAMHYFDVGLWVSPLLRLIWFAVIFIHGNGHVIMKFIVDKDHPFDLRETMEGITVTEFLIGLVPLAKIHTPWVSEIKSVSTGDTDPNKVTIKALGGPMFNFIAAVVAQVALSYGMVNPGPVHALILHSFVLLNIFLAVTSVSDYVSAWTGQAQMGFACGYLDFIIPRVTQQRTSGIQHWLPWGAKGVDDPSLLPITMLDYIHRSTRVLSARGTQAYGFTVTAQAPNGDAVFLANKDVNPKRAVLHTRARMDLEKELVTGRAYGYTALPEIFSYSSHLRFGTSSAPSPMETHPHLTPQTRVRHYDWSNPDKPISRIGRNFQISIAHNGDYDGIRADADILRAYPRSTFAKEMSFNDLRNESGRLSYHDPTNGDSPVIALAMYIFNTQGRFDASTRLAYISMSNSLKEAFEGLTDSSQIQKHLNTWGWVFEKEFIAHKDHIFQKRNGKWVQNATYIKNVFLPAMKAAALRDPQITQDRFLRSFSTEQINEFVETTMYNFLNMDTQRSIEMLLATALESSAFGLSVNNTLEPTKKFWVAKGQPGALGHNPKSGAYIAASDPTAVLAGLNEDSKFMTFNDDNGEIVVMDFGNPVSPSLSIFSMADRRQLSDAQISARWVKVRDNPYFKLPKVPEEGESNMKRDIRELNETLNSIRDGFDVKHRGQPGPSNRVTADNFEAKLIEIAKEHLSDREHQLKYWYEEEKTKWIDGKLQEWIVYGGDLDEFEVDLSQFHPDPSKFKEKKNQEADLVFICEGPSYDVLKRKVEELESFCPGLHVRLLRANDYMNFKDEYYSGSGVPFKISSDTVLFCVSQSGMTFSDVDAIRDAMVRVDKGQLGDVFIMTGEWFSILGRSIGQEYFHDSKFTGKIFSNMSGRRYTEASTMAAATDFFFTNLFLDVFRALYTNVPEGSLDYPAFNMRLSSEIIEVLDKRIDPLLNGGIERITGHDKNGKEIQSKTNRAFLDQGQHLANHVSEQMFVDSLVRAYTFISCLLCLPFFKTLALIFVFGVLVASSSEPVLEVLMNLPLLSASLLFGIGALAHVLDAILYTWQGKIFTYVLRFMQGRAIMHRIGSRAFAIGGAHADLLRDYFRNALLEAPAGLSLASYEGRITPGQVVHSFKDAPRGSLVLIQVSDPPMPNKHQSLTIKAWKMVVNQLYGVQNLGTGPEIIIQNTNPENADTYRFKPVSVNEKNEPSGNGATHNNVFRTLDTRWFDDLKLLIGGQVVAAEMAEALSTVRIPLYVRTKDTAMAYVAEAIFAPLLYPLSRFYSRIVLRTHDALMQIGYRVAPNDRRMFQPGKGQSGLDAFTTQIVPPSHTSKGTAHIDMEFVANQLMEKGLDENISWFPQGPTARFMARMRSPSNMPDTVVTNSQGATISSENHTEANSAAIKGNGTRIVKTPWGAELEVTVNHSGDTLYSYWSVALLIAVVAIGRNLPTGSPWITPLQISFLFIVLFSAFRLRIRTAKQPQSPTRTTRMEVLEDRNLLNADARPNPPSAGFEQVEIAAVERSSYIQEIIANDVVDANVLDQVFSRFASQSAPLQGIEVVHFENGRMTEVDLAYIDQGETFTLKLTDFRYESGAPVSFIVDGLTARFVRPDTAIARDEQSGIVMEFKFDGNFVTQAIITQDNEMVVIQFAPVEQETEAPAEPKPEQQVSSSSSGGGDSPVVTEVVSEPGSGPGQYKGIVTGGSGAVEDRSEGVPLKDAEQLLNPEPTAPEIAPIPVSHETKNVDPDTIPAPDASDESAISEVSYQSASAPSVSEAPQTENVDRPFPYPEWREYDVWAMALTGFALFSMAATWQDWQVVRFIAKFFRRKSKEIVSRLADPNAPIITLSANNETLTVEFAQNSTTHIVNPDGVAVEKLSFIRRDGKYFLQSGGGAILVATPNRHVSQISFSGPDSQNGDGYGLSIIDGAERLTSHRFSLPADPQLVARMHVQPSAPIQPPDLKRWMPALLVVIVLGILLWSNPFAQLPVLEQLAASNAPFVKILQEDNALLFFRVGLLIVTLATIFIFSDSSAQRLSWSGWGQQWMGRFLFVGLVFAIAQFVLWTGLVPVTMMAWAVWLVIGSVLLGYLIPYILGWTFTVLKMPFRLLSRGSNAGYGREMVAVVALCALIAMGYLGMRMRSLANQKPQAYEQIIEQLSSFTGWPEATTKTKTGTSTASSPLAQTAPRAAKAFTQEYLGLEPQLYTEGATDLMPDPQNSVPLIARFSYSANNQAAHAKLDWRSGVADLSDFDQRTGQFVIDPKTNQPKFKVEDLIHQDDWLKRDAAFVVTGGKVVQRLETPIAEAQAKITDSMIQLFKTRLETYQQSGMYKDAQYYPRMNELLQKIKIRVEETQNYVMKQQLAVSNELQVPLKDGERGFVIQSQRPLGTISAGSVQAWVHSEHRNTVRIVVPTSMWQTCDVTRMQVRVALPNGPYVDARVVRMAPQIQLGGKLVLTLGLESDQKIFGWDTSRNAPQSVNCQISAPLLPTAYNYSSDAHVARTNVYLRDAVAGERLRASLDVTGTPGRLALSRGETEFVHAKEIVGGVKPADRKMLEEIQKQNLALVQEYREYIANLRRLEKGKLIPFDPIETEAMIRSLVPWEVLNGTGRFMDMEAKIDGFLIDTYGAVNQLITTGAAASIMTPEIPIAQRIEASIGVAAGDIVIVRRQATGQETLGRVRQVNKTLGDQLFSQKQGDMQQVLVSVENDPDFWIADNEPGIRVIYAPQSQDWLKAKYAERKTALARTYAQSNVRRTFPVQFGALPENAREVFLQDLLTPAQSVESQAATPATSIPATRTTKNPKLAHLFDANPETRWSRMALYLQDENNITADAFTTELDEIVLSGHLDLAQMALDYLYGQRRIMDLINLHEKLNARNADADMTRLARAHIFSLIEQGNKTFQLEDMPVDDPLARLVQRDRTLSSRDRAAAEKFLRSVLCTAVEDPAYDHNVEVVVRLIIQSDFWRTHEDKLAVAHDLEGTPAANLIRNSVFAHIAAHSEFELGRPQKAASNVGLIQRLWDPAVWYRTQNMLENDVQDRARLGDSPWMLSAKVPPQELFKGTINDKLFELAMKTYEAADAVAKERPRNKPALFDFSSQTTFVRQDYIFGQLNSAGQRNYVPGLGDNPYMGLPDFHAVERFLLMAENSTNQEYKDRREQLLNRLVSSNNSQPLVLQARLVLRVPNGGLISRLVAKDIDNLFVEEISRLKHLPHEERDQVAQLVYEQALAKLCSPSSAADIDLGRRMLILRETIETLTDYELRDFVSEKGHPLLDTLVAAGVPKNVAIQIGRERFAVRPIIWAIDRTAEWSGVTIGNQVYKGVGASLSNLQIALAAENFNPNSAKEIVHDGLKQFPREFNLLTQMYEYRAKELNRTDGKRDEIEHLETWRFSLAWLLGSVGLVFGLLANFVSSNKSRPHTPNRRRSGFFGRFLPIITVAGASLFHGAGLSSADAKDLLDNAPRIGSNGLNGLGDRLPVPASNYPQPQDQPYDSARQHWTISEHLERQRRIIDSVDKAA